MEITTAQLRQVIREEIQKMTLNEAGIKDISTVIPKLDALAKKYGFKMQGSVNKNPKGVDDTIAKWNDTTPGYQRQFVDLYMENGELWVNWGSFKYNEKYADGSGNDPVRELFNEKSWKNFFGTLEQRKNKEL